MFKKYGHRKTRLDEKLTSETGVFSVEYRDGTIVEYSTDANGKVILNKKINK